MVDCEFCTLVGCDIIVQSLLVWGGAFVLFRVCIHVRLCWVGGLFVTLSV